MTYTGTQAFSGRGTQIEIGNVFPSPTAYIPIEEVNKCSPSGNKLDTDDASNFESGINKELISTMRDNGEIKLDGNFLPTATGQLALQAALQTGQLNNFKLVFASGPNGGYDFTGYVTSFEPDIPVDKFVKFTASIKITGPFVWTSTP